MLGPQHERERRIADRPTGTFEVSVRLPDRRVQTITVEAADATDVAGIVEGRFGKRSLISAPRALGNS